MKAIILAAGKGQRLGKVTEQYPKPMVQVSGKPILEHNIILLEKNGVKDIYINLYHFPEVITEYFGSGSNWGVNITYKYEENLLGTSGAVKNFSDSLHEDFLVLYGDNFFNPSTDIDSLIKFHNARESDFTMALCMANDISLSGQVKLNKEQKVIKLIEKQQTDGPIAGWVNAGLYIMKPSLNEFIVPGYSDFSYDFIPFLIHSDYNVLGFKIEEKVIAIDTPILLEEANKIEN